MVDTAAPAAPESLQDRRAPQRDQLLEGLRAARLAAEQATPPEPAAVPAVAPAAPAAEPVVEPEPAAVPVAEHEAEAEPAEPPEPAGMAAVRKAEQHARRQLAQERAALLADLDGQKAAWQAKIDKAAEVEARIANARQDPLAAMAALGFSEADFESVGRLLYAHSPEGQKDPRHKAAAAQTLAQREQQTVLDKLQRELAELKQGVTAREQAAESRARAEQYMAHVTKAVGDDTPLARAALAKNPGRTTAALYQIALRLYQESGPTDDLRDDPTPAEVLRAYDVQRAAELEELGIDPKSIGRPTAPAAAAAPRPAATLAPASVGAPIVTRTGAPPSRDDVLAGLAKMRAG